MTTQPTTTLTPAATPTEPTPPTPPAQDPAGSEDPVAEVARLKDELAKARKWEDRAKANAVAAKELETLRQSTMSDMDKAVAQARNEGRVDALREAGVKLASAEIRVAAAGRNVDIDALIEGIDAAKFLDVNGDPDTKAISAWVDRVAPAAAQGTPPRRDLGAGVRGPQAPAASSDPLVQTLTELANR